LYVGQERLCSAGVAAVRVSAATRPQAAVRNEISLNKSKFFFGKFKRLLLSMQGNRKIPENLSGQAPKPD